MHLFFLALSLAVSFLRLPAMPPATSADCQAGSVARDAVSQFRHLAIHVFQALASVILLVSAGFEFIN